MVGKRRTTYRYKRDKYKNKMENLVQCAPGYICIKNHEFHAKIFVQCHTHWRELLRDMMAKKLINYHAVDINNNTYMKHGNS